LTEEITLHVVPRTVVGKKSKRLRREGWVPLVLYGPDFDSELYQANALEIGRVLAAAGMTSLVSLKVKGRKTPYRALVRDVQRNVLTDTPLHVDFYRVSMTHKITTEVPIELVGESPAVAQADLILLTFMDRVEIECLPGDLVSSLRIDLSPLQNLDDFVTLKDISVPEGITILADEDEIVARVALATRVEEEEEEEIPVEIAAEEVEVIAKGKAEKEEEEPAPEE
jgi:large subunit ribosomal protein L25